MGIFRGILNMVNRGVDHLCSDSIWRLTVDSEQS